MCRLIKSRSIESDLFIVWLFFGFVEKIDSD